MKPLTLAGALLGLAVLPAHAHQTDVVLSGTFAGSLSHFDSDNLGNDFDFENNASRIGIFASVEERRLKGFLHYERGAANDSEQESVREFFGGLSGFFGTAVVGRKSTEYKLAGVRVDPFYNTSLTGTQGSFASTGASYGLSELTNDVFTDNTVAYISPSWYGLTGNAAVFVNDNGSQQDDDPSYAVGLNYANADWGMTAAVQYLKVGEPDVTGALPTGAVAGFPAVSGEALRLTGTYAWRAFAFGVSFEQVELDDERDTRDYGFLSATYRPLPKLTLAAAYGVVEDSEGAVANGRSAFDGNGVSLGAFYEVITDLNVYAGGRFVSLDSTDDETTTFAAGFSYSFDVDLE